jgi:S-methylmethionine-dependent homocysteine/selenocysteine methylase
LRVPIVMLDGGVGAELVARGAVRADEPWGVRALTEGARTLLAVHRDFADAGATVHTAMTFRTRRRVLGEGWGDAVRTAVRLAREGARGGLVAGSIAPLADCWRPDLSPAITDPARARAEHAELAELLAREGCDVLLCETFPRVDEAILACEAAAATGVETWVSFTPGYDGSLMSPGEMARGAREAVAAGAGAVLVNCCPAERAMPFVRALIEGARGRVPAGAYANAGAGPADGERVGAPVTPGRYAGLARDWAGAGAAIIGGCCGAGPAHVAAAARALVSA